MKPVSALISALALTGFATAAAQDTVNVPLSVDILNPGDLVSLQVTRDGDLGQIARSATTVCNYRYRNGVLMIEDGTTGESVPAPGATSAGCAQFGTTTRPILELSCPPGMNVQLEVGYDLSLANTSFGANSVFFDGSWVSGTPGSHIGYDFVLSCPSGANAGVNTFPLELGVEGSVDFYGDVPSGERDVNIPINIVFE